MIINIINLDKNEMCAVSGGCHGHHGRHKHIDRIALGNKLQDLQEQFKASQQQLLESLQQHFNISQQQLNALQQIISDRAE